MDRKLVNKLYKKYPKIFKQKDLPMSETCMCWGIDAGNGWYTLIDNLCSVIKNEMKNEKSRAKFEKQKPKPQIEAVQVKEKFGELRFYTNYRNCFVAGAISLATRLSVTICEFCGSTDSIVQTRGWIHSLCSKCLEESSKEKR